MEAYINGIGAVSPQDHEAPEFLSEINVVESFTVKCLEPDYKSMIAPSIARRMSRIVKMSIASSKMALEQANVERPNAIVTGTAMGCLQNTEKFLEAIIDNDEQFLAPTAFILSTHNTVGAQIALLLKCYAYNMTYVQSGLSFETALLDAYMLLDDKGVDDVLLGGHDEMTSGFHTLYDRIGYWKKQDNENIITTSTAGVYSGEGAAFFALSKDKRKESFAKISELKTVYRGNKQKIKEEVSAFVSKYGEPSLVLYGISGDHKEDAVYLDLMQNELQNCDAGYFKHLCGEYGTASSFALFLASKILKNKMVPTSICVKPSLRKEVKNILIVNGYRQKSFSLIYVEHA
tara:strand:+ start:152 stop:1192 length:1041 start_codon:yes stop_codon:yes gene_type:complete